ncbi:uncharacterized protein MELLADRAFT_95797 [Melampsora larici-populina 98AG31]|uniref:SCD domain-containing protein n=1 Tax=Melampsora larici-populina (strain 98AG31 / pathotype 3-4-7) TaxID=747676 RepID=F4RD92_MELLP|nr:uncharacterized protein MELLADRAFT_95797 [Melampsora larici-populina 98AG31]EGG09650.1 hypothetical protein MELLADRAFT_95797 [Melampsora larici-populina 98AG31]
MISLMDSDPRIQIQCTQALGQWMNQLPDCFLGGHYLQYLGWVLEDNEEEDEEAVHVHGKKGKGKKRKKLS